MRFFGVAGLILLTAVGASCAALSGLDNFTSCTDDCEAASKSPASVGDAAAAAVEDAPASVEETSVEDTSEPYGDVMETLPEEGTERVDTGLADATGAPPVDAQPEDVASPPVDSGVDSMASVVDSGAGPTCGPLSSRIRCSGGQVCCANLAPQTNSCTAASSCASNATLQCATAADCPSSAPICCAQMSLVPDALNDAPPKCTATGLSASCAATCNDNPPTDPTTCKYPPTGNTGLIRLCSHNSDCTSDTALTGPGCYNFNGAPISWCSGFIAGGEGIAQL